MIVSWKDDAGNIHTGDEHGREYRRWRAAHPEPVDQGPAPAEPAKELPAPPADPSPVDPPKRSASK